MLAFMQHFDNFNGITSIQTNVLACYSQTLQQLKFRGWLLGEYKKNVSNKLGVVLHYLWSFVFKREIHMIRSCIGKSNDKREEKGTLGSFKKIFRFHRNC